MEENDLNNMVSEIGAGLGLGEDDGDTGLGSLYNEPEPAPSPDEPAPSPTPEPAPAPAPLLEPPKTWRKEAVAHWQTLPEVARAEILKREDDIFKGLEQYRELAGVGRNFQQALSPFQDTLRQYNVDPVQQVAGLMQAHITLATGTAEQKHALFSRLAADYGVNLAQLAAAADPSNAPFVDPAVQALQSNLQSLQSRLDAAERDRQLTLQRDYEKQIEAFSADPANAHFQEVVNDMAVLLEKGVVKTLSEAYEKAVWANPVTRQKELDRQSAAAAEKAKADAAERAAKARRQTAGVVRVSARGGSAAAPLGSIDDTLAETLRAIQSRN